MANLASPLRPLRLRIYRKVRKVFAKDAKGKRSNYRRGVVYQPCHKHSFMSNPKPEWSLKNNLLISLLSQSGIIYILHWRSFTGGS